MQNPASNMTFLPAHAVFSFSSQVLNSNVKTCKKEKKQPSKALKTYLPYGSNMYLVSQAGQANRACCILRPAM